MGSVPVTVRIAVLGLGEAGSEIARDLVAAGADVRGYDPKGFSVDGVAGSWTTFTNKGYDAVWTRDNTGTSGRLHHLSFAVDSRDDVIRAADLALEHGIHIETGPHKHTIQQSFFLYVWEPAGNRIELDNAGARLVFAPDWQPVDWNAEERAKGQAWGLQTISTFHTHGTPPVEAKPRQSDLGGSAR